MFCARTDMALTRLITEEYADKRKDIFIGMWRPPLAEVMKFVKIIPSLLCGDDECFGALDLDGDPSGIFKSEHRVKERWLCGDFDSAVYKRIIND